VTAVETVNTLPGPEVDLPGLNSKGELPSSVVTSSANPTAAGEVLASEGSGSRASKFQTLAEIGAVARSVTALNLITDFGAVNVAEVVTAKLNATNREK